MAFLTKGCLRCTEVTNILIFYVQIFVSLKLYILYKQLITLVKIDIL